MPTQAHPSLLISLQAVLQCLDSLRIICGVGTVSFGPFLEASLQRGLAAAGSAPATGVLDWKESTAQLSMAWGPKSSEKERTEM